jgi:hypothetical protein
MVSLMLMPAANICPRGVARRLSRPPLVTARADRNVPGMLAALWEATEVRARRPVRPWDSPDTPPWITAALEDFGRQLLVDLAQGSEHLVAVHAEMVAHLPVLRRILPDVQHLMLTRDGRLTDAPIDPMDAGAGLDWAKAWAASIDADVDLLPVDRVRTADLQGTVLEPLCQSPWPERPVLQGAALAGFSCWAPARDAMRRWGYAELEPPDSVGAQPALIEALARGEAETGDVEAAVSRIQGALRQGEDALLQATLGDLLAQQGDEGGAHQAWAAAARAGGAPSVWVALLSQPERPEGLGWIRAACAHQDTSVRAAAARWLVARGMDAESAEAITSVRHERWYARAVS